MAKRPKGAPDGAGPSLIKLANKVLQDPEEVEAFVRALSVPDENKSKGTQSAVLIVNRTVNDLPFLTEQASSWMPQWTRRLSPNQKPGGSELHEKGHIYCLDLSSVFEASILQSIEIDNPVCLDLCASPGGKSIFASRCLSPRILVSNEVIGKRTAQLISNLKRCNIERSVVTSMDPAAMKAYVEGSCDLVIVDAPCTGQSLLARGKHSPGCFHPSTIKMNSKRQRRIIACAGDLVAPGGYIAYMTCTFSRDENEDVLEWFLDKHPEFSGTRVDSLQAYQSHLSSVPCYRMWPHHGEGSGGFTSLLRRSGERGDPPSLDFLESIPTVWRSAGL